MKQSGQARSHMKILMSVCRKLKQENTSNAKKSELESVDVRRDLWRFSSGPECRAERTGKETIFISGLIVLIWTRRALWKLIH